MHVAVITQRTDVRSRLASAFRTVAAEQVFPYPTVEAFLQAEPGVTLVVVDLGSMLANDPQQLAADLTKWRRLHPSAALAAYVTLGGAAAELGLLRVFAGALGAELLTPALLDNAGDFREFMARALRTHAELLVAIRTRFLAAVAATGRSLASERPILTFLELAPLSPSVGQVAQHSNATSVALARRLRSDRTLLASDLILLMKLLWWVHLRDAGWSVKEITTFLHTNPRSWRKHTHDRLRLTARILQHVPTSVMYAWV